MAAIYPRCSDSGEGEGKGSDGSCLQTCYLIMRACLEMKSSSVAQVGLDTHHIGITFSRGYWEIFGAGGREFFWSSSKVSPS